MFSTDDTIVAIATPPGRGGDRRRPPERHDAHRSRARCSPSNAIRSSRATRRSTSRRRRARLDEVVATFFPSPHSYTGEDVVEISAHGSPVVLQAIVRRAIDAGARLAEPGEFTLRAFLNGGCDLIAGRGRGRSDRRGDAAAGARRVRSAGGHADAIASRRSMRALFDLIARLEASVDFPDEGYHFVEPSRRSPTTSTRWSAAIDRLLAGAAKGRIVREGAAGRDRRDGRTQASRASSTRSPGAIARSSPPFQARRAISSPRRSISEGCA